jgi:hypothetical protein
MEPWPQMAKQHSQVVHREQHKEAQGTQRAARIARPECNPSHDASFARAQSRSSSGSSRTPRSTRSAPLRSGVSPALRALARPAHVRTHAHGPRCGGVCPRSKKSMERRRKAVKESEQKAFRARLRDFISTDASKRYSPARGSVLVTREQLKAADVAQSYTYTVSSQAGAWRARACGRHVRLPAQLWVKPHGIVGQWSNIFHKVGPGSVAPALRCADCVSSAGQPGHPARAGDVVLPVDHEVHALAPCRQGTEMP